jgi:hypothetical protein
LNSRSFFVLGDAGTTGTGGGIIELFANGSDWVLRSASGNTRIAEINSNVFEQFEFSIDWNTQTFDIRRNGSLLGSDQPFYNELSTDVSELHLFNLESSDVAAYDEINIGCPT